MSKTHIERFHLLFCQRLVGKMDRTFFSLKGGCNLRFFFGSIRYSEDIDFDVQTIAVEALKKNVSRILDDGGFRGTLLNAHGVEIAEWSAPKQTETTQRWKVTLRLRDRALTVPTKIEFSRRSSSIDGGLIEPVPPGLITAYGLQPVILQHYGAPKAITQKIGALIHRTETQARDVMDLHLLKNFRAGSDLESLSSEDRVRAIETLMSVHYDDYKSQVWPYLMEEYQDYYGQIETWNRIQSEVVELIESWGTSA